MKAQRQGKCKGINFIQNKMSAFFNMTYVKFTCNAGMIPDSALLMSTPRKSIWHIEIELVIVIMQIKKNIIEFLLGTRYSVQMTKI